MDSKTSHTRAGLAFAILAFLAYLLLFRNVKGGQFAAGAEPAPAPPSSAELPAGAQPIPVSQELD